MAKPEKIMKKCTMCGGKGVLPDVIARELPKPPKPGQKIKCPPCGGKGFRFEKPKK